MIKVGRYKALNKNLNEFRFNIQTFVPSPKESDYQRGYITRYFTQRANDPNSNIFEISKDTYRNIVSNPLLISTSLDWKITGDDTDIKKSNSESVRLASQKINKLQLYLPNLLQFKKKT
jgi:hypothetical protein